MNARKLDKTDIAIKDFCDVRHTGGRPHAPKGGGIGYR